MKEMNFPSRLLLTLQVGAYFNIFNTFCRRGTLPRAVSNIPIRIYDNFTVVGSYVMDSGTSDVKKKRIRKPYEFPRVAR